MAEIELAAGRRAFGADPGLYDRARPEYPSRLFELLRERCAMGEATRVLEIGPGTGQATRFLLLSGVASVVAIEPDPRLSAFLTSSLAAMAPGRLTVRTESFEDALLHPATFDLGVAATSFHWLEAQHRGPKIFASLAPGGWWAMWWMIFSDPFDRDPFYEATQTLFNGLETTPSFRGGTQLPFGLDSQARIRELASTGFVSIEHETIRWKITLNAIQLQGLYGTFSQIARLGHEAKVRFMHDLARIVNEQFAGRVERTFLTPVYLAQRPR